jgi:hypothetical protein
MADSREPHNDLGEEDSRDPPHVGERRGGPGSLRINSGE